MNSIDILEEFLDYYSFIKTAIGSDDIREFEIKISKNEIKAISNLIAENKEKDEEIENQDKTIDRLVKEQEEREKYTHQLESENKELDKFIKEGITIEANSPYKNFQLNYLRENFIQKSKVEEILDKYKYTEIGDSEKIIQFYKELQSLLGKE